MDSMPAPRIARVASICAALGLVVTCGPSIVRAAAVFEAEKTPTAELADGTIGADHWWASAMLPEEAQEREEGNLCLSIFFLEVWPQQERAEGSEATQCGPLGAHEVMFQSSTTRRRHKRPHTAVAFLLDGTAARIVLKLKGEPAHRIRLRHLPPQPATSGRRMAYFARGYARPFCLQSLVAYDSAGHRVAHLRFEGC